MYTCESNVYINLPLCGLHYPMGILKHSHLCLWLQALKLLHILWLLRPLQTAMSQFRDGHDLLAEVQAGDNPSRGKGKKQKGAEGPGIGALPGKKAKKLGDDTSQLIVALKWESAPRMD